jgi:hypothetical protein
MLNAAAGEECEWAVRNATCDPTTCVVVCDDGFEDCNDDAYLDGCETDTTTEEDCGDCDIVCSPTSFCFDTASAYGLVCGSELDRYPGGTSWDYGEDWSPNYWFTQAIVVTGDAFLTSIGIYTVDTPSQNIKLALYTDATGEPGDLLLETAPVAQTTGTTEVPVSATLLAAGVYWLAAIGDNLVDIEGDHTVDDQHMFYYAANFADPAPDPWPTASDSDYGMNPSYSWFLGLIVIE